MVVTKRRKITLNNITYWDAARAYSDLLYHSGGYWTGVILTLFGMLTMILEEPFSGLAISIVGFIVLFVFKFKIAKEKLPL